jgi:hypothetical protein
VPLSVDPPYVRLPTPSFDEEPDDDTAEREELTNAASQVAQSPIGSPHHDAG